MKPEWLRFIKEMIKHGDETRAYRAAYKSCKSDKTARTNAYRLLKNAVIIKKIKDGSAKVTEIATKSAAEVLQNEIVGEVLTATRKREILFKIASGEHDVFETFINRAGKPETYKRKPTPTEIAKAIEIDNKMTGDNAPQPVDVTSKGNEIKSAQPIMFLSAENLSDEQIEKYMSKNAGTDNENI